MPRDHLTSADSHFSFGENWARFAGQIDQRGIAEAEASLRRLLGCQSLEGHTFLDVGSGSGIHSLAALRLGCAGLLAIDIDETSVETTRRTLSSLHGDGGWECRQISVLDLDAERFGTFDILYAWGVLHHTGSVFEAISSALRCLAPGGVAVLALYRRTRLCGFWRMEKRWYSRAPAWAQGLARGIYITLHWLSLILRARSVRRHIENYPKKNRGMDYFRDVHDWLGGYPYESISHDRFKDFMAGQGLEEVRSFVRPPGLGLFGSGNNEYVFRRVERPSERAQALPR